MTDQQQTEYIQVGMTALRAPDGSFLPSVPLYIRATPEARASEAQMLQEIGTAIAQIAGHQMKRYIDETRKAAAAQKRKAAKKKKEAREE